MAKTCKHNHECEQCIRIEIKKKEKEIAILRNKLPHDIEIVHLEEIIKEHNNKPTITPPSMPYWINSTKNFKFSGTSATN